MNEKSGAEMLAGLLTDEQMKQAALHLRYISEHGYGKLEIVVQNGKVRYFVTQLSFEACFSTDSK
jgi:hypothetical protein